MTPTLSPDSCLIALMALREKIAACHRQEGREAWLIPAKLRHQAMDVAARFVDPSWVADKEETE